MGQIIKKRRYRRKKTTRGTPGQESIWVDIIKRTAKTFLQVTLGVIATLLVNPPDKWKPALIAALSTGFCTAMNYLIQRVKKLIGDPEEDANKENGA